VVLGLVWNLRFGKPDQPAWIYIGLLPGVSRRLLVLRRLQQPSGVPLLLPPDVPAHQLRVPGAPQFGPLEQQRAERRGGQGGAARPE
jgi:hypothetical protein